VPVPWRRHRRSRLPCVRSGSRVLPGSWQVVEPSQRSRGPDPCPLAGRRVHRPPLFGQGSRLRSACRDCANQFRWTARMDQLDHFDPYRAVVENAPRTRNPPYQSGLAGDRRPNAERYRSFPLRDRICRRSTTLQLMAIVVAESVRRRAPKFQPAGGGGHSPCFLTHAWCLERLATLSGNRFDFTSPESRKVSSVAARQRGNGCGST
jgi:hypothetical protein